MNTHTSSCDHMIFVAKSSPERTRVPRRVTDRLTVRHLVNINPGRPRTSSTAAPRKPQHHCLRSPRSESKSFSFLKQTHGVKRAIKEAGEGGDDRDGLRLQGQFLGWEPGERSAPPSPVYYDDNDDGDLDVSSSGSDSDSDSDSDGGAPLAATTSA
jgi:hypothetical protein